MTINILITGFNRPESFLKVLNAVNDHGFDNLFLSVDVAKSTSDINYIKNIKQIELVKSYADGKNNVHLIVYNQNQGCRMAVSKAISRCFEVVDELIILEDDCIPLPGFFDYCSWALNEFRYESSIGSISSQSFLFGKYEPKNDYFFSKYHHCWGWATWKRAWDYYDDDLDSFSLFFRSDSLKNLSSNELGFMNYWLFIYKNLRLLRYDSWAYRWLFSCWKNNMISVVPRYSLVRNVGFSYDATHTKSIPYNLDLNYSSHWKPNFFFKAHEVLRDYAAEKVISYHHYRCWMHTNKALLFATQGLIAVRNYLKNIFSIFR